MVVTLKGGGLSADALKMNNPIFNDKRQDDKLIIFTTYYFDIK
jgi:hypothetical protein